MTDALSTVDSLTSPVVGPSHNWSDATPGPSHISTGTISVSYLAQSAFTKERVERYRCSYEEGFDPDYHQWLKLHHPKSVPAESHDTPSPRAEAFGDPPDLSLSG